MNPSNTFLQRVQPAIDALPEGEDKTTLLALVEARDALEHGDVHPKDRARAMRRLLRIDASGTTGKRPPPQSKTP